MSYEIGYREARKAIITGFKPQKLLNDALCDIDEDEFTRGWMKACVEAGAIHPLDENQKTN